MPRTIAARRPPSPSARLTPAALDPRRPRTKFAGLITAVLLLAAPATAAERIAPSTSPERVAFGIILVGTVLFFAWVAWLTLRR